MNYKILIAEDEPHLREILKSFLEDVGFEVVEAEDGPRAVMLAKKENVCAVITDITMPGMDGSEVIMFLERTIPDVPVFITSALPEDAYDEIKKYKNVCGVFTKPYSMDEVEEALKKALDDRGFVLDW